MTNQTGLNQKSKSNFFGWVIFILFILGLTLPFHYVPSSMKIFAKDHFTFKYTLITEKDISEAINRYNNANNIFEQISMNNDPFIKTLREQGIIVDQSKTDKSNEKSYNEPEQSAYNNSTSGISILAEFNNKYPHEVKLLDNPVIKIRIKNLISDRYDFFIETWAVESPIKVENNTFIASACQAHNCSATNFILIVDLLKDIMYVGIKQAGNISIYSEDGSSSPYLSEWENKN